MTVADFPQDLCEPSKARQKGNELAEAILLPITRDNCRDRLREIEFREEQGAFPNEIWERGEFKERRS